MNGKAGSLLHHTCRCDHPDTVRRLLEAGARTLFDSSRIPGEIVDLIAVRDEVVRDRTPALIHLLQGWFDAVAHIVADPVDAARRMAVRQQSGAGDFLAALTLLHLPSLDENLAMLAADPPGLASAAAGLAAVMRANGLLRDSPALASAPFPALLAPGPLLALARDRPDRPPPLARGR